MASGSPAVEFWQLAGWVARASGLQEVGAAATDVHTASACNDVDSCFWCTMHSGSAEVTICTHHATLVRVVQLQLGFSLTGSAGVGSDGVCTVTCASGLQEVGAAATDVHTTSACNDVDSCC